MYIKRKLEPVLIKYSTKFPVIAVVGPRQAGKTTLIKESFKNHKYFSLEDPDTLDLIKDDPRYFLEKNYGSDGIILDEFQNYPKILSYMQGIVDTNRRPGYFILTGSHNFLMNQAISQSLAGRIAILTLLPLSISELKDENLLSNELDLAIFKGSYPDLFHRNISPPEFYPQYIKTYVERDVRQLTSVVNLNTFQRFISLCAGRIGQILNLSSLADDCGINVATAKNWISILEASYIIFLLQPHFKNYSKRIIKSPKLYFYDTGLACRLLKIENDDQVTNHYLKGGLVESFVISNLYKEFYNQGKEPSLYFWRDSHGHEIDCLLDYNLELTPIEIKSSKTIRNSFFDALKFWSKLAGINEHNNFLVYGGDEDLERSFCKIVSWKNVGGILDLKFIKKT